MNEQVTLAGEGADVVNVTNSTADHHVFNVTADYVNISGFNVSGATGEGKAGFYLLSRQHCNISNDNASGNYYGIYLSSSSNNTIYNNHFNNTNNAYDDGNNTWNTTPTTGTNIFGGSWLGGNYWSDYAGADTTGDGLGDTLAPYNSSGNIANGGDYHPLVTYGETPPVISFISPTPDNGTTTTNTSIEINVSITEANLDEVKYNWNGTNYTMYNDSLVLMLNLDNVSALGENDTHVVDVSGNGNNGTAESGASYSTSGKYGGAFEFDGVNGHINNGVINLTGTEVTISAWVNAKKLGPVFTRAQYVFSDDS